MQGVASRPRLPEQPPSHATTTIMVSAESLAPDAVAPVEPARVFIKPDSRAAMSSGHLSDGGRSLSRRSRVRRKNSHRDDDSSSDLLSTSGDISSGQLFVKIPPADARSGSSPKSLGTLETGAPPRPPRSPRRQQAPPILDNKEANPDQQWIPRQRTRSTDPTTTRPVIDDARGRETRSENGQHRRGQRPRGLSLPRHAFRNNSLSDSSEQPSPLTPNAFIDIPPMPVFAQNRRYRHQPRDSGVTQQSTTSSSLYPKSTSTEGSYPSPPSLPAQDTDDRHIITVDPADNSHYHELHEMDADDVSYRLRLLMQNTYYLPPAHSKPFSETSSPDTPRKSPLKSSSPTFFDIFKVVKKKSSAASDHKAATVPSIPMLRTTSDSSTLSGLSRPQQPALPTRRAHAAFSPPQPRQETKGRVVVVRERMDDLVSVAKQVEQELKVREAERRRIASNTSHSEDIEDDFVDPTDSVDLPLVPSNEFFGPQAALLRGMGIDSSVGAALLADQLPPSSPGIWSVDSEDVAWRMAILHAAVGHSLNSSSFETPARSDSNSSRFQAFDLSSPAASTTPSLLAPSVASPVSSLRPLPSAPTNDAAPSNSADVPIPSKKRMLGQRILNRIIDEDELHIEAPPLRTSEKPSSAEAGNDLKPADQRDKAGGLLVAIAGDYEPVRASSPSVPTTPLLPPPRRPNPTPAHSSGSRSDNTQDKVNQADDSPLEVDAGHLRVDQGTALRLSDAYEAHVGLSGAFGELTPSGSQQNSAALSAVKPGLGESFRVSESPSMTSGSHYSDDEEDLSTFHTPREHTLASTYAASRPSLGSASIPRASCESSQLSPTTSAFRDALDRSPYAESFATQSVVNTLGNNSRAPSRVSDHEDPRYAAVSPPPRVSSSFAHNVLNPPPRPRRANSSLGPFVSIAEATSISVEQEEPPTPTGLHVPRLSAQGSCALEARSNAYPASPISFFDAVEMQSQQEEEEESSESDDEDGGRDVGADEGDDASVVSSSIGGYQSDSAGIVVADPRTGSIHSVVHDPRQALRALMQQRNVSLPQLGSRSSLGEPGTGLGYETLDRRKAITNVPQSSSRTSFWYRKQGKRRGQFPNPPRISESTADRLKHEAAKEAFADGKRPQTAGSRTGGANMQSWQKGLDPLDPSVRRLDGMLIEHMEREKEVLKRITTTLSKSST